MRITVAVALLLVTCAVAQASDADTISALLDKQDLFSDVYVDDAPLITSPALVGNATTPEGFAGNVIPPSSEVSTEKPKDKKVTVAADGKSAWASFSIDVTVGTQTDGFRVSDLLVKTPKGWKVAATAWTVPMPNKAANKRAKAGELSASTFEDKGNDESLATAFKKLTTDGLDATAAARKDLLAIGTAANEKTTTGAALAKAWKSAWVNKSTVTSIMTRVSTAGTTGWVAASVELQKKGYTMPFTVFCVFEKTSAGEWTLVHVHFSV